MLIKKKVVGLVREFARVLTSAPGANRKVNELERAKAMLEQDLKVEFAAYLRTYRENIAFTEKREQSEQAIRELAAAIGQARKIESVDHIEG